MNKNIYKIYSTNPEHVHLQLIDWKVEHCIPYDADYVILVDTSKLKDKEVVGCCVVDRKHRKIVFIHTMADVENSIKKWFVKEIEKQLIL